MDIRNTEHRGWIGWRMTGEWSDRSPDTVGGKEAATKNAPSRISKHAAIFIFIFV